MNQTPGNQYEQVINLMKSILSLEYCLQYQIIPLNLEQGCLTLGMVNPKDGDALDFVRTITNALGYSLKIKRIESYNHQLVLAEYLKHNYTSTPSPENKPSEAFDKRRIRDSAMTVVGTPLDSEPHNLDNKATIIAEQIEKPQRISKTELEDDKSTVYAPIPDTFAKSSTDLTENQLSTLHQTAEVQTKPESLTNDNHQQTENLELDPFLDFDISELSVNYCLTQEYLQTLTPQELWQELFTKILEGSIAKLYLEQKQQQGKILWSPDGSVESSLDNISLAMTQALVKEIKILAKIPLQPLEKTKKVAIEKYYQQERLQLHIEVCPSQWGDNITIQVLRGDALKLYEQKQIKKMSQQALSLAQKLVKTLNMMRTCFEPTAIDNLAEIITVKQEIEQQLILLTQLSEKNK